MAYDQQLADALAEIKRLQARLNQPQAIYAFDLPQLVEFIHREIKVATARGNDIPSHLGRALLDHGCADIAAIAPEQRGNK